MDRIYVDGGVRKQHLGKGKREEGRIAVVFPGKKLVEKVGNVTNNQAEYLALIRALKIAAELKMRKVEIASDSELIVRQMKGEYRVADLKLQPLYKKALDLTKKFDYFSISYVPREANLAGKLLE